ncbi:amino acid ABC transporter ATP-binding protein [Thalassospira mesophila]|uniref:Glutamine ABC transporter ATP-binding protein n=1 Tax=Thalassospira mesophila TaxID=1293891 RepID=A0A1Y2KY40_9PROT|nr:amino acid ABC transporter ATP-binding protein [Thalassospira mesophila]OSQ37354.1 glutamine ABC transporter ATP-binding protein [Thalassospira mesophila]
MLNQSDPILRLENIGKYYGRFQALADISLSVQIGEKIVICGPSGSGKSTLIRCVNRIEAHDSGRVIVAGHELTAKTRQISQIRQDVGMVFQSFNLFPHLTILQNCMLAPIKSRGLDRSDAEKIAQNLLSKVHIANQAHKYPAQLSGGQQQRAAIARALCMKPQLMLFDEPTSALDPEMVQEVLDTMAELASEGMTMLCVTHEMSFARQVADRVIFMADGRIVESSPTEEFFRNAQSERARSFLRRVDL